MTSTSARATRRAAKRAGSLSDQLPASSTLPNTTYSSSVALPARDLDCAFQLLRAGFLRHTPLQTRRATMNVEQFYTMTRAQQLHKDGGGKHEAPGDVRQRQWEDEKRAARRSLGEKGK